MNAGTIFLGIGAAAGVQMFLGRLAPDVASRIDVFLILIAAVARTGSPSASIVCGAVTGGIEDALAGGLFGLNGFSKSVVGYLLSTLSVRLLVDHPLAIALSLASGVLVNSLIVAGLRFLLAQSGGASPGVLVTRALLTGLAGVAAAMVARHPWRERRREARMRRLRG